MFGFILVGKVSRVRCGEEEICGGRFYCVYLPQNPRQRQIRKAARLLKKQGVKRVVFPAGYDTTFWRQWGIEAVDGLGLRRCLLLPIIWWALGEGECVRAGICAPKVDFWVQKGAAYLAGKSRYLFLDCGAEAENLAVVLQREWGVATVREPTAAQLERCQILALFEPREELACQGRGLPFYEGAEIPWQYSFWGMEAHPEADSEQLGAALLEMGRLGAKDVEII